MSKKAAPALSYFCAMPMLDDIRSLGLKGQAKVCKFFHQYLAKNPLAASFFTRRFEETYSHINMRNLDATIEWIRYTINDKDNSFHEQDINSLGKEFEDYVDVDKLKNVLKQEVFHVVDFGKYYTRDKDY
jgi:hypothetical protein